VDAPNILATNAETAPDPEPTSTQINGLTDTQTDQLRTKCIRHVSP